jgi:hypothetical protein
MKRLALLFLFVFLGRSGRMAPSPPSGQRIQLLADSGGQQRIRLSWNRQSTAIKGYHIRVVANSASNPTWPADYPEALIYHQLPQGTLSTLADTITLPYRPSDSLALKFAIRACDTSGVAGAVACGAFGTTNTLTVTWYQPKQPTAAPPPPPPPPPSTTPTTITLVPIILRMLTGDLPQPVYGVLSTASGAVPTVQRFQWTSSDTTVAQLVAPGRVSAAGPGSAIISAFDSATGAHAEIPVTVGSAALLHVTGMQVVNLPTPRHFLWSAPLPLFTGGYKLELLDAADSVTGRAACTVTTP